MRILQNARKCESFIQLIQTNPLSLKNTNGLTSLLVVKPQSIGLNNDNDNDNNVFFLISHFQ